MIHRAGLGAVLLISSLAGCASHWPESNSKLEAPTQTYQIEPKDLLGLVKDAVSRPPLSLGIEEEKDGSILTGYQQFPGEWHIARRWQEQTRYRITVIRDWANPTTIGRLEVRETTEQRAADGMKWEKSHELQRPERSRELLKKLDEHIKTCCGK